MRRAWWWLFKTSIFSKKRYKPRKINLTRFDFMFLDPFLGILSWSIGSWMFQECWRGVFGMKWLKIRFFGQKKNTALIFQPLLDDLNLSSQITRHLFWQATCHLCIFISSGLKNSCLTKVDHPRFDNVFGFRKALFP
jgi:hypothetical protein